MLLGFVLGVVIFVSSPKEAEFILFNENLFFFALLPPIVFDAGYSMKRTNFFRNMYSILMFAVVGTVISTFIIGYLIWALAKAGAIDISSESVLDPLIYGALISSIDPIATLAILGNKSLNVPPLLYSLVFGESVLNDAISITLFQTFKTFRSSEFTTGRVFEALGTFLGVSIGSVLMGGACALISAAILRKVNFISHPSNEFIIIFFFAYASYCLAEIAHLSGIIAIFCCGVMQAHYAWYNISNVSRTTTRHAFHSFSHIAEAFLYAYVGITAVLSTTDAFNFKWSWKFIIFSVLLCFVSRAFNIFPLSFILNLRRKDPIPFRQQVLMWFSGLRGAVSFALVLTMDAQGPDGSKYITTTIATIIITTLIMGGMSNWIVIALGIAGPTNKPIQRSEEDGGQPSSEIQLAGSFIALGNDNEGGHEHGDDDNDGDNGGHTSAPKPSRKHVSFGPSEIHHVDSNVPSRLTRSTSISRRDLAPGDENLTEQERAEAIIARRRRRGRTDSVSIEGGEKLGYLHDLWIRFDVHYMQPWFGGKYAPRMEGDREEDNSQMPNPYLAPHVEQVEEDPAEAAVVAQVEDSMAAESKDDANENHNQSYSHNHNSQASTDLEHAGTPKASLLSDPGLPGPSLDLNEDPFATIAPPPMSPRMVNGSTPGRSRRLSSATPHGPGHV